MSTTLTLRWSSFAEDRVAKNRLSQPPPPLARVTAGSRDASDLSMLLVTVGVVAGPGPAVPREVDAGSGWSFLTTHGFELAHALLGALVLARSAVVTARGTSEAGAGSHPVAVGWLVALTGSIVELVHQRRRERAPMR